MIYANPVPIANACQMGSAVVRDTLAAIFKAIVDLITLKDKSINLAFGFCNVYMRDKNLSVPFAEYLTKECSDAQFEQTMKRQASPVATLWRTSTEMNFRKSNLGQMIQKPNASKAEAQMLKTEALRMMSMDMSSSAGFTKLAKLQAKTKLRK